MIFKLYCDTIHLNKTENMEEELYKKINSLFKRVRNFILCGIDESGYPTAKAVLPCKKRKDIKNIYFVTNTNSNFVRQISENSKSSVYFFSPLMFQGCLLKGSMKIVEDISIKKDLWKNSYKCAYPNPELTYNDPDFCVLKFTPIKGRYYYNFKKYDFVI